MAFALGIAVKILFSGFSPLKRLQRKARPASWRETPKKTIHKLPFLLELDLLFIQPFLIFLQLYYF